MHWITNPKYTFDSKKLILDILFQYWDQEKAHSTIYELSSRHYFINSSEKGGESTFLPLYGDWEEENHTANNDLPHCINIPNYGQGD